MYCISHGGGRRCHHDGCGKAARGSTFFCVAHGGDLDDGDLVTMEANEANRLLARALGVSE